MIVGTHIIVNSIDRNYGCTLVRTESGASCTVYVQYGLYVHVRTCTVYGRTLILTSYRYDSLLINPPYGPNYCAKVRSNLIQQGIKLGGVRYYSTCIYSTRYNNFPAVPVRYTAPVYEMINSNGII